MNKLMKNISFTKNETKVIIFVITVLITGFSIKFYKQVLDSPSVRFDYSAEDSVFKERSTGKLNPDLNIHSDSLSTSEDNSVNSETNKLTGGLLNINNATRTELIELPGIGESTADKIISYRERNKKFKKTEDIMNVSGIGRKKYEKLKNYIKAE